MCRRRGRSSIYREWLINSFCWDGFLPVAVILISLIIAGVFPNQPGVGEVAAIVVPLAALAARLRNGLRRFRSSDYYGWQFILFGCAIGTLGLFDGVFILFETVPNIAKREDWILLACLFAVYMVLMLAAFFPARQVVKRRLDSMGDEPSISSR